MSKVWPKDRHGNQKPWKSLNRAQRFRIFHEVKLNVQMKSVAIGSQKTKSNIPTLFECDLYLCGCGDKGCKRKSLGMMTTE